MYSLVRSRLVLAATVGITIVALGPGPGAVIFAQPAAHFQVPEDHPGGPFYSVVQISPVTGELFFPHTEEWGAAPFERDLTCVPPGFNLLDLFDVPGAWICDLTVEGHLVFEDAGPPPTGLLHSTVQGLGEVPIVFARWAEIEAAIADGVLTLPELLSLPSAVIGVADFYKHTAVRGSLPDGQLMFKINASGVLEDGRFFRLHANKTPNEQRFQIQIR